jgi:hypothetical protein
MALGDRIVVAIIRRRRGQPLLSDKAAQVGLRSDLAADLTLFSSFIISFPMELCHPPAAIHSDHKMWRGLFVKPYPRAIVVSLKGFRFHMPAEISS